MGSSGPKRFLMAVWEGGGTLPPEMEIARKLIARGHSVRVIGDPTVEPMARAAGCGFATWVQAPHRQNLDPETDIIGDWKFKNPLQLFAHAVDALFCGPAAKFAADTLAELERNPADMVLADAVMTGALMAAESRGLPRAVLVPNIYLFPAPGIPPIGVGFAQADGPIGRIRDRVIGATMNRMWRRGLPAINRARVGLGLRPVKSIWEQNDLVEAVFVLTSPSFDFKADRLPPNVRYVGAQIEDPSLGRAMAVAVACERLSFAGARRLEFDVSESDIGLTKCYCRFRWPRRAWPRHGRARDRSRDFF
jgi:UDP:flavonoid glycosyltransferase YjiC (YdhE family)